MNSGPLSVLRLPGLPLCSTSCWSTRTTLCPGREVSTSIQRDSRLKSSITFSRRNFLPSVRVSLIKSRLQVWFGLFGITSGSFTRSGKRFFALRRIFRFILLYTRLTFLWFHLLPRLRNLWWHDHKPIDGWRSTSPVKASCKALSSFVFGWYWYVLLGSCMILQALLTLHCCSVIRNSAASLFSAGPTTFFQSKLS